MIRSIRAELTKLVHWPAFWAILAVWGALTLTFAYAAPFITYANPAAGVSEAARQATLQTLLPSDFPLKALPGYPLFGGVIALTLGALTMGSEYGWGTWTTLYLQQPRRAVVAAGKLLALACAVLAQVLVGLGVALAASIAVAVSQGAPVSAPTAVDLLASLGASWLIVMGWAAVGAALATALRSTAIPIGVGFAYLLIDRLIGSLAGQSDVMANLARGLIGTDAGSLASSVMPSSLGGVAPGLNTLLSGPLAAGLLAAYVLGASGLTALLLARRDVS